MAEAAPSAQQGPIAWTASEFIAHRKSLRWYGLLVMFAVALAALTFLVTHDAISVGVVVLASAILGFYGTRQPRVLKYELSEQGLNIAGKFYAFDMFKSFSVADDGAFANIVLTPLKRFMPPLSIYYSPEDESKIMDLLAERLPVEEHHPDAVDHLIRRIRL